jgi:membrane protein YqaA with SNARE-associated domain
MFYKIGLVTLMATFEIYAAIGTGMAFGLSSLVLFLSTLTGGVAGVFIAAFLGDKIKNWIQKYKKPKEKKADNKSKMLIQLWDKYGIFGLGFIGTFLMGAPISMGIAVGLGVSPKKLIKWSLIAVLIRCFAFSYFFNYVKGLF